jgi:urease accessory protein
MSVTEQTMVVTLHPHAALFLLPDPVTCFESASYNQIQKFRLHDTSSLVLLDWVTSGRRSIGEHWLFHQYYSVNEVSVDNVKIVQDSMLLKDETDSQAVNLPRRSLAARLAPYTCYATLILCGPLLQPLIEDCAQQYKAITVFQRRLPDNILWSLSPIAAKGIVIRIAGRETEDVKDWLRSSMAKLVDVVGEDAYRRAFV